MTKLSGWLRYSIVVNVIKRLFIISKRTVTEERYLAYRKEKMESEQPDLNYQVLESNDKADCADQDFIPLVNMEPKVIHEGENTLNETKQKWIIKFVMFFILVLCLSIVALALGLVNVSKKDSEGMNV